MTLIKTSILNAIAVVVRMLTLLGINKVLALYVGPTGYAALGQFQNAVQMISVVAGGAINTGVTKYTAEYHNDAAKQRIVWQTAGSVSLIGVITLSVLVLFFKEWLAKKFLNNSNYDTVFAWFAITLFFFVFNALLLSILNGKKDISRYVIASIAGSVIALCVTVVMVANWALLGALTALAIYQSLAFFATLLICLRTQWFHWRLVFGRIDFAVVKNLAKFAAMTLTSAIVVPLSHILIRNHLGQTLGWDAAGYWEAIWRLSGAYLMLVSTTLSVYYLPRLSELKLPLDIRKEIILGYRFVLPITILSSLVVFFFRETIILILFSEKFLPVKELFFWQLVGDVLKIVSWLMGFVLIAKAMMTYYIATEIFFSVLFYGLLRGLIYDYGLVATGIAYAAAYFLHIIFLYLILRKSNLL